MKPKILYIATDLDRCEVHIILGVLGAGFEVELVAKPGFRFKKELEAAGVITSELRFRGRIDPFAILRLRHIVSKGRYDVLHFLSARAVSNGLLASLGLRGKKVAYRGTIGHLSRLDPSAWLSFLSPLLDKIVCVSEAVKQYLATRVSVEKLVVIHKGHNPAWYQRASRRDLSRFEITESAFVVSCVANMRPVKGIPFLLDAIDAVPSDIDVHLLLVGTVDGSVRKALSSGRQHPNRIHAVGFQEDSSFLVSQSDCFVLPSIEREGLPKSLLEAMSVGVAPIATRVGGMPEVIQDGENGLLVPPRDSKAIAEAIERLARNPTERKVLARNAYATISTVFTLEQSIQKTVALYREVVQ